MDTNYITEKYLKYSDPIDKDTLEKIFRLTPPLSKEHEERLINKGLQKLGAHPEQNITVVHKTEKDHYRKLIAAAAVFAFMAAGTGTAVSKFKSNNGEFKNTEIFSDITTTSQTSEATENTTVSVISEKKTSDKITVICETYPTVTQTASAAENTPPAVSPPPENVTEQNTSFPVVTTEKDNDKTAAEVTEQTEAPETSPMTSTAQTTESYIDIYDIISHVHFTIENINRYWLEHAELDIRYTEENIDYEHPENSTIDIIIGNDETKAALEEYIGNIDHTEYFAGICITVNSGYAESKLCIIDLDEDITSEYASLLFGSVNTAREFTDLIKEKYTDPEIPELYTIHKDDRERPNHKYRMYTKKEYISDFTGFDFGEIMQ